MANDRINKQIDRVLSANSPATLMAARSLARFQGVPIAVVYVVVIMVVASWVPLAFAVRAKFSKSTQPRIHIFQDMDNQAKYKAQAAAPVFANEMAMRPPIAGTVARGQLEDDDFLHRGYTITGTNDDGTYAVEFFDGFPDAVEVTPELVARGKELFARYCYLCHGLDGYGNGPVHVRATNNVGNNPKWVQPSNLHDEVRRDRSTGHLYNTVANGIRNMKGYGQQIPAAEDRWAIVAYVKALQMSQDADASQLPAEVRDAMPVQPTLMNGQPMNAAPAEPEADPADGAATTPATTEPAE